MPVSHMVHDYDEKTCLGLQALLDFGRTPNTVSPDKLQLALARHGLAWPAWIDFVVDQLASTRANPSLLGQLLSGDYVDRLVAAIQGDDRQRHRLQHVVEQVAKTLRHRDIRTTGGHIFDPLADQLLCEAIADAARHPGPLDATCEVRLNVLGTIPSRGFVVPLRLRRLRLPEPHQGPGFRFVRAPWSTLLDVDGELPAGLPDADTFAGGLAWAAAAVQQRLRADAEPAACSWDIGPPLEAPLYALRGNSAAAALALAALYLLQHDLSDREQIASLRHIDWRKVAVTAAIANAKGDLQTVSDIDKKIFAWVRDRNSPFRPTKLFGCRGQKLGHLDVQAIFEGVPDLDDLVLRLGETAGDGLDSDQHRMMNALRKPGPPQVDDQLLAKVAARPVNGLWSWLLRRWARDWMAEPMPIGSFYVRLGLDLPPVSDLARSYPDERDPPLRPQKFGSLRQMLQSCGREHGFQAWLVTGPPGCGKTVMLREHQLTMARQALQQLSSHESPTEICILVPMKDYQAADANAEMQLEALAQADLGSGERLSALIERYPGAVRLVFDGINEIGLAGAAPRTRQSALNDLMRWVRRMDDRILAPVFTNRDAERALSIGTEGFKVLQAHVLPWGWDEQHDYCRLRLPDGDKAQRLINELQAQPDIRSLCELPMNLSFQCELFNQTQRLALNRGELFCGMAWLRLRREYGLPSDDPHRADDVEALAPELDRRFLRLQDTSWIDRIFDLPQGWIIDRLEAVGDALVRLHGRNERSIDVRALEKVLAPEDLPKFERLAAQLGFGMLSEDNKRFQFAHQLWGEFFAARRLARAAGSPGFEMPSGVARDQARVVPLAQALEKARKDNQPLASLEPPAWEETVKMAAELARDAASVVGAIASLNPVLAARASARSREPIDGKVLTPLRGELLRLSREDPDLRVRVEAGLALGEAGDTLRYEEGEGPFGRYRVPRTEYWVTIEGGRYWIGSRMGEGHDDETPVIGVDMAHFGLASLLVTNAEWQCFIDGGGYVDPQWRSDDDSFKRLGVPRRDTPIHWKSHTSNNPAQPVVGINYWDAQAYVRWLNAQTKSSPHPGHRRTYRLPTEAEWEVAARGRQRDPYPWGKQAPEPDRCNFRGTQLGMTSPVGVFPASDRHTTGGKSLSDLAGNVWEWTSSRYTERLDREALTTPTTATDASALRLALRSGYWNVPADYVRAAYRLHVSPGYLSADLGMRLAGDPIELRTWPEPTDPIGFGFRLTL